MMPQYFEQNSEPIAQRVTAGLSKIGMALRSQAWQGANARGLSPTQGQVLALLASGTRGLRLGEVAQRLGVSAPTASDSVRALVEKGLVHKEAAPDDARAVMLTLTLEGKKEATNAASWPDFLLSAVGSLSEPEQEEFLLALVKVIRCLTERGQIHLARTCVNCKSFEPNVHEGTAMPHHCRALDAPLATRHLRVDCIEHEQATPAARAEIFARFLIEPPKQPD